MGWTRSRLKAGWLCVVVMLLLCTICCVLIIQWARQEKVELKERIADLVQESQEARTRFNDEMKENLKALNDAKREILICRTEALQKEDTLTRELERSRSTLESVKSLLERVNEEVEEKEEEIEELMQLHNRKGSVVEECQEKLETCMQKAEALYEEDSIALNSLRHQVRQLEVEAEVSEKMLDEREQTLLECEANVRRLESVEEEKHERNNRADQEVESLKEEIMKKDEEWKQLREELRQLEQSTLPLVQMDPEGSQDSEKALQRRYVLLQRRVDDHLDMHLRKHAEVPTCKSESGRCQLLITGCGRSATSFISKTLSRAGFDMPHEAFGADGSVQWERAVDTLGFERVLHQVRHPLKVIGSVLTYKQTTWTKVARHIDIPNQYLHAQSIDDEIARAAHYWLKWNKRAHEVADWTYRVEDVDLGELCHQAGFGSRCKGISWESVAAPTDTNSREHIQLTWKDLERVDHQLAHDVKALAALYGYPTSSRAKQQLNTTD